MTIKTTLTDVPPIAHSLPAWLAFLLAGACGLIAANVYYAQPLIGLISSDLGLSPQAAGLISCGGAPSTSRSSSVPSRYSGP